MPLATCVNSSAASSTACSTLFTAATVNGEVPSDTLQAMLNIAQHPAQNVAALFNLVTANPPFQPTLPPTNYSNGQPNDWTMSIGYPTGVYLNYMVLDSKGNAWATGSGEAFKISNAGALLHQLTSQTIGSDNYTTALAVDLNDNLWIDDNSYAVTNITADGALVCAPGNNPYCYIPGAGTTYASVYGGLNYLIGYGGIAVDASNNMWVGSDSNAGNSSLVEVSQSGYGLANYMGAGVSNPSSVVIDMNGNFWLPNYGSSAGSANTVVKVSPSGVNLGTFSGGGIYEPVAIAFDHGGNAWVGNDHTLTELSPTGAPSANSPISGGGIYFVNDVAVDGLNNVWVSSYDTGGIAEFNSAGVPLSPSNGFSYGGDADSGSVAIDASGNVWSSGVNSGLVREMVGMGAPTVTPLALASKNGTIGIRP